MQQTAVHVHDVSSRVVYEIEHHGILAKLENVNFWRRRSGILLISNEVVSDQTKSAGAISNCSKHAIHACKPRTDDDC